MPCLFYVPQSWLYIDTQESPMVLAVLLEDPALVKVLISYGAGVNIAAHKTNISLLCAAAKSCNLQILFNESADIQLKWRYIDPIPRGVFNSATGGRHFHVMRFLLEYQPPVAFRAALEGSLELVQLVFPYCQGISPEILLDADKYLDER